MKAPLIRDWCAVAWALVLLGLSADPLLTSFKYWGHRRQLNRDALSTTGVVVDSDLGGGDDPDHTTYKFKNSRGTEYTGSIDWYVPEGEHVQLEYLASNPEVSRIKGIDSQRAWAGTSLMWAIFLVFISALFFHAAVRKDCPVSDTPFARFPIIVLCAASSYILYTASSESVWPYAYYQILRWVVCVTGVVVAVNAYRWGRRLTLCLFVAIGILFNPVAPIHLTRASWSRIDIVAAGIMLAAALLLKPRAANGD